VTVSLAETDCKVVRVKSESSAGNYALP
jgi:hypothetical protein